MVAANHRPAFSLIPRHLHSHKLLVVSQHLHLSSRVRLCWGANRWGANQSLCFWRRHTYRHCSFCLCHLFPPLSSLLCSWGHSLRCNPRLCYSQLQPCSPAVLSHDLHFSNLRVAVQRRTHSIETDLLAVHVHRKPSHAILLGLLLHKLAQLPPSAAHRASWRAIDDHSHLTSRQPGRLLLRLKRLIRYTQRIRMRKRCCSRSRHPWPMCAASCCRLLCRLLLHYHRIFLLALVICSPQRVLLTLSSGNRRHPHLQDVNLVSYRRHSDGRQPL